jgi:hypothetical protein
LSPDHFMLVINLFNYVVQTQWNLVMIFQGLWSSKGVKRHMNNRLGVTLATCKWSIHSCMKFMVENYSCDIRPCVENKINQFHLIDQVWVGSSWWSFDPYPHWYLCK